MAKRVIRINKSDAPAGAMPSEMGIKGPAKPIRLGQEPDPAELSRTQPMKRIVVTSSAQRRQLTSAARPGAGAAAGATEPGQPKPRPKKKSGPPLWLIPVGIIAVVLIIILISSSSNRQDPYFANDHMSQYAKEKERFIPKTGPQPMKEWMNKRGESDMAKERKARMHGRPTTTANPSN